MTRGWRRSYSGGAVGPYLYAQPSARSFIHCGARKFSDEWQSGWALWLTVCVRGRYLVMWRRGGGA